MIDFRRLLPGGDRDFVARFGMLRHLQAVSTSRTSEITGLRNSLCLVSKFETWKYIGWGK